MDLKPLRSLLFLLALSMLFGSGATAQSGHTQGDWELRTRFADDYRVRNFRAAIADGAAFMKLHPFDHEMPRLMAQAYYLSRDKTGCVKFIKHYLNPSIDDVGVELLGRCQASNWQPQP